MGVIRRCRLKRIEGFNQARGGSVIVRKAARGDTVQVLWWNGER
ncbi:hypothetical protein FBZ84_13413 [Azospirillum baldaniorum]|nr:hypothetical protein FBZ84_13413 [Azospirillum baldaniorum]